jgi:hypothetical protein
MLANNQIGYARASDICGAQVRVPQREKVSSTTEFNLTDDHQFHAKTGSLQPQPHHQTTLCLLIYNHVLETKKSIKSKKRRHQD